MLPPGRCRDQAAALGWVRDLVAAAGWRADRAGAARAILALLVRSMDWETGLVTALTTARMAETARRSTRTVSRVLAWAVEQGLLVQAEAPASAAFLGSTVGRTPTYAVYRPTALTPPASEPAQDQPGGGEDQPQDGPDGRGPVLRRDLPTCGPGGLGDLPRSSGYMSPSRAPGEPHGRAARGHPRPDGRSPADPDRSCDPRQHGTGAQASTARREQPWPLYVIPAEPAERERALNRVLEQVGIAPGSITGRTRWTLRGLLRRWWDAGLAPAGVVHALGHHPDRPGQVRSTLTSGVRDLAAVAGARLRPWNGRLGELPDAVRGHHAAHHPVDDHIQVTDASRSDRRYEPTTPETHEEATESVTAAREPAPSTTVAPPMPGASPEHRARMRAWLAADLTRRRDQRAGRSTHPAPGRPGHPR